jgi:hypothetical protein
MLGVYAHHPLAQSHSSLSLVSLFLHTDWRDYVIQVYHERRTAALSLAHIHHLDGPGVGARRDRQNEADEGGLPNRGRPR